MKVAVFTETFLPKIDGVVSILCLMLQRLNEKGHQVILFGPPGGPAEYAGAEIVGVGGPRLPFYPELRINIPRTRVWERVQEFQPDLVHVVNPFFLGPFGLSYARRLNIPVVASYHTDVPRYARLYSGALGALAEPLMWSYLRALHNQAHLNLCPSTTTLKDLRAHGFNRVRWWKRGIDTELFSPGERNMEMRARLTNGNPDDFLVINVGRQSLEKSLDTMRDPLFKIRGVRLAMIGGGPAHEQLKTHYRGTPTVFPGYLRGKELVEAYRAADLFLFPSTTETFGLVALESMACHTPVVAARAGGVLDIIEHGQNGFFFDPDKPHEITPLVQRLKEQPELHRQIADNGLAHARSRSWQATMDQLIDYYGVAQRVFNQSVRRRALPRSGV